MGSKEKKKKKKRERTNYEVLSDSEGEAKRKSKRRKESKRKKKKDKKKRKKSSKTSRDRERTNGPQSQYERTDSNRDFDSVKETPAHEMFRMALAVSSSALEDIRRIISDLDRGGTTTLNDVKPESVKELLVSALRKLSSQGVQQTEDGKFAIINRNKVTLREMFKRIILPIQEVPSLSNQAENSTKNEIPRPRYIGAALPNPAEDQDQLNESVSSSDSSDSEGPKPMDSARIRIPTKSALLQSQASALKAEIAQNSTGDKPVRGEWMTKLPEKSLIAESSALSLSQRPRSFKNSKQIHDKESEKRSRSMWTQNPNSAKDSYTEAKQQRSDPSIVPEMNERADNRIRERMERFNSKTRNNSLMAQHKAKLEKQPSAKVNKEFSWNRDRDMDVAKVDPKNTKKIVEEADQLYTRFSRPSSSRQFL